MDPRHQQENQRVGHGLSRRERGLGSSGYASFEPVLAGRKLHHRVRPKQLGLHNAYGLGDHARLSEYRTEIGRVVSSSGDHARLPRTRDKNSSRVCLLLRNSPSIALVTACPCCFSTPRICMHRCRASMITPTPSGLIFSEIASAIWLVMRS